MVIFLVDVFEQTSTLVTFDVGNARVGGGIFPVSEGITGVAVANQWTGMIDVWHVEGSEVAASFPVDAGEECPAPVDLITIGDGTLGALACQASAFGPTNGVLVFQNLAAQMPPAS